MSNPVHVADGDIRIRDNLTNVVDYLMHIELGDITLASNTAVGDLTVMLVAGHGASAGELIRFEENKNVYEGIILSVVTNTITLDTPIDFIFTTEASGSRGNFNLNVDGSSTAVVAHIEPPTGAKWNVTRVTAYIQDGSAMDDSKFGGISALTNGVVLRRGGTTFMNIFNAKTNGDLSLRAFDTTYTDKAPAGKFGFRFRRSFSGQDKNGVAIGMNRSLTQQLQLLIQDDLTDLEIVNMVVQGHEVLT